MARTAGIPMIIVDEIKRKLWDGVPNKDIAADTGLSQGTISSIKNGIMYSDARWPDTTQGALPEYRRIALMKGRQRQTITSHRLGASNYSADEEFCNQLAREAGFPNIGAVRELVRKKDAEERRERIRQLGEEVKKRWEGKDGTVPPNYIPPDGRNPYTSSVNPDVNDKFTWEYVLSAAGNIPIVQVAEDEEDQHAKDAICVLFKQIAPSIWKEPVMIRLVTDLKKRIQAFRAGLDDVTELGDAA